MGGGGGRGGESQCHCKKEVTGFCDPAASLAEATAGWHNPLI